MIGITRKQRSEGMALPMVLWAIALLTAIALLLAGIIGGWIEEEARAGKLFRARQQALSGIAVAMNQLIRPGDPLLKYQSKNGEEGYSVKIKDESGLINPNYFLSQTPDRRDLLKLLFLAWKVDQVSAEAAADSLYDWQSQSPFRSLKGAKKADYEAAGRSGLPPGAPFITPEEMELALNFEPIMQAKPDWKNYFTSFNLGPVNILRAPKSVLTDLLGLTPQQADNWMLLRAGKDGIEGTEDDVKPEDIKAAASLIGANGPQRTLLLSSTGVSGNIPRIESTGFCNGVKHRITVISTDNAQSPGAVLRWTEE
jgi:hypothetical protein